MNRFATAWRNRAGGFLAAGAVAAALLLTQWLGLLAPVDQTLRAGRFQLTNQQPSGETLFVEIDATSLSQVGVWPWPRQVHADILDKLMALGAAEVVFDIDFSTQSTPSSDAALADALERAGGYAYLAAFQQIAADGTIFLNQPLPELAAHADAVLVNVDGDGTGLLNSVPAALPGHAMLSVAQALVPTAQDTGASITIDYGIDLNAIDRISAAELLFGTPDPARITNKQVIVGASAIELRDFFLVPRFGVVPGPLVQLAATETLRAGRQLSDLGTMPAALLAAVAGVGLVLLRKRTAGLVALTLAGLGCMVLVEALAWLVQWQTGWLADTALFHLAFVLFGIAALLLERAARWRQFLAQQARLAYLATHDPASGGRSRQALIDDLNGPLGSIQMATVFLVHLGRLDRAIASLGHDVGEAVAREVVSRIERQLGVKPARIGLDLFAWALFQPLDAEEQAALCRSTSVFLDAPYAVEGHEVILASRFGTATGAGVGGAELLRQADVALAVARSRDLKSAPFNEKQNAAFEQRRLQDVALRQALRKGEFYLLFQPQIDLATREMTGVEALVRWHNPGIGHVSPSDFIPLAEETGLIVDLGDWILEEACRQAVRWPWQGSVAVNVSSAQFQLGDVVGSVSKTLARTGFPANRLVIEITESLFVSDDSKVMNALVALRQMGVRIALDDFGTGYSSLSYLARLPIDKLKIDQAFVRPLPEPHYEALVETIILMAKRLGKVVVAEGVETEQQRDYLASLGCEIGQGYLFSRPAAPEALGLVQGAANAA